ncbi:bifunctional phosphoribosylaminoimidazolecarboxamide formyltransferase/inosine monophosphate cyclohydrolase [Trueperella sp. LYQ141]|uniref:bifunctional phosphoribosylaminoimidazolecarboxamide formyltransferase/inosine monophosphate cyclohydrolase n=1 Tax=Trueperella sp. LYQ141 TaxID=3391058 RepID=UPI0039837835
MFRRALISVSDKSGVLELTQALAHSGCEIVATGSTFRLLTDAGIAVRAVSEVTGFPEAFDGRVKTLHPAIHGGILARPERHGQQMAELGISPFDLVVVNLYPFAQTLASGASAEECVEQIDIGGPALIRAAAKNIDHVLVVIDPADYPQVIELTRSFSVALGVPQPVDKAPMLAQIRRDYAARAFAHTAQYDAHIAQWMNRRNGDVGPEGDTAAFRGQMYPSDPDSSGSDRSTRALSVSEGRHTEGAGNVGEERSAKADQEYFAGPRGEHANELGNEGAEASAALPEELRPYWTRTQLLRYGENPHQRAALYRDGSGVGLAYAQQLGGKPMSFNNYLDAQAAWRAVGDHDRPAVAIVKHSNPCGIAVREEICAAYQAAYACDPQSAFGGIVAANRTVDHAMAQALSGVFMEVVIAPDFTPEALEILRGKSRLRILRIPLTHSPLCGLSSARAGTPNEEAEIAPAGRGGNTSELGDGDPRGEILACADTTWESERGSIRVAGSSGTMSNSSSMGQHLCDGSAAHPPLSVPRSIPDALGEWPRSTQSVEIKSSAYGVHDELDMRVISGGVLVQERDSLAATGDDPSTWQLVSGCAADEQQLRDLLFAWRVVRGVKSNAVVICADQATCGIGMGQVNRVDACHLAVQRAGQQRATGAVAASDAFFPFPDGVDVLVAAGVRAIVQPGGSIRDEQVIAAAQQAGITMYLTGVRHFAH